MEEESYMQLNYKDMKKWYNDNKELKEKYRNEFLTQTLDMVVFPCSGKIWRNGTTGPTLKRYI